MSGIELREQTSRGKAPAPILSRSSGEISNRMCAALVLSTVGYLFAILAFFVMQSLGFNPWSTIASGIAILIVPVSVLLIPVAGFLLIIATTRGQDTR